MPILNMLDLPAMLRFSRFVILVRKTWSKPVLSSAVVVTIAIGICSTVTLFSVFSSILLRDLPYASAERIAIVGSVSSENQTPGRISLADAASIRTGTNNLSQLATFWPMQETVESSSSVRSVKATFISPEFFPVFAVQPKFGRLPVIQAAQGAAWGAVLSHRLWVSEFGASPLILGRPIRARSRVYEVVAVMPPEFGYPDGTDIWLPLESWDQDSRLNDRSGRYLLAAGLLAPRASLPALQSVLDAISLRLAKEFPQTNKGVRSLAVTLRQSEIGEVRPYVMLMLAVTSCLMLICCGNVAGLLFARVAARRQEIAVRLALGASRLTLLRQFLAESLVLGAAGGALGTWGALMLLPLVRNRMSAHLPDWVRIEADWTVLCFAVTLTLLASLASALPPAYRSLRRASMDDLRAGCVKSGRRDDATVQRFIVSGEIALSLTLLMAALLLSRSFRNLSSVDAGIQPDNVVVAHIVPYSPAGSSSGAERLNRLLAELKTIPGITAVGGTNILPFTRDARMRNAQALTRTSSEATPESVLSGAMFGSVAPGYFAAMGIPLRQGRVFSERDGPAAPRVAVVSDSLANALWRHEDPLGRQIRFGDWAATVVGVVGNVKYSPFEVAPASEIYAPFLQQPPGQFHLTLHFRQGSRANLSTVRDVIQRFDRSLVITSVQSMNNIKHNFLWREDLWSFLSIAVAAAAVALIGAGILGLVTFVTRERLYEFGIRAALGATPMNVAFTVLCGGLRLACAGLLAGIPLSLATTGFLQGLLFGIAPTHASTFMYCSGFLTLITLLACAMPASLAVHVDPAVALRSE
jgi:putative ABC transport system permease protein